MGYRWTASFLDLTVAIYRLAVRADNVLGVIRDVAPQSTLSFRDHDVTYVDLSAHLGGQWRPRAPFAVVLESKVAWLAIGVDAVGNLRPGKEPNMVRVPGFGLRHPEVFAGALRIADRLLLVLQPDELQAAVALSIARSRGNGERAPDSE